MVHFSSVSPPRAAPHLLCLPNTVRSSSSNGGRKRGINRQRWLSYPVLLWSASSVLWPWRVSGNWNSLVGSQDTTLSLPGAFWIAPWTQAMPLFWLLISVSAFSHSSHTPTKVTALFQLTSWEEFRKGPRLFCSYVSTVQSMGNLHTLASHHEWKCNIFHMKTVSLCSANRQVPLAPVPQLHYAQAQNQSLSLCPQTPWHFCVSLEWSCWRHLAWLWRLECGSSPSWRLGDLRPPSLLLNIFLLLEHYAYRDNSWFHLIFHWGHNLFLEMHSMQNI